MSYDKQTDPEPDNRQQLVPSPFPSAVATYSVDDSSPTIFESLVFRALLMALLVATLESWFG